MTALRFPHRRQGFGALLLLAVHHLAESRFFRGKFCSGRRPSPHPANIVEALADSSLGRVDDCELIPNAIGKMPNRCSVDYTNRIRTELMHIDANTINTDAHIPQWRSAATYGVQWSKKGFYGMSSRFTQKEPRSRIPWR